MKQKRFCFRIIVDMVLVLMFCPEHYPNFWRNIKRKKYASIKDYEIDYQS